MKRKSIKANAILNIIYTLSNIIFPLITFPYISRILSVNNLGKVTFFTSIANYAIMLASLGISTYGIRSTAKVRDDKNKLSKITHELFIINFITTIFIVIILLTSILFVDKFRECYILLLINIIYIFSAPFGLNWLYSGLEQYSYITKRSIIIKIISLIMIFALIKESKDYIIYALILVLSYVVTYICNFIYAKKFISYKPMKNVEFRKHFKPMLLLFVSILAINIYTHLDTVMLGFIRDDKEVGLYTIAVYVKTALLTLVNAISVVLLPRVSYYYEHKKEHELNNILKKSTIIILMISLPLTLFFMITAKDSILILGGTSYLGAKLCMQIIMPVLLFSSISNITGNQILIPLGKDLYFMKAVISGSIIDLILNIILMPKYGCVGAAIATLFAELLQMALQLYYSKDYLIPNLSIKSIIKIVGATIISSFIVLLIVNMINFSSIVNMIIFASIYFILYYIVLLILKEEIVVEMTKKIFHLKLGLR